MAVTHARVVDPDMVAGTIRIDINNDEGLRVPAAPDLGCYARYESKKPTAASQDTLQIVLTRFVVDTNVEVNDIFDCIEQDMRSLPKWTEHLALRDGATDRTEGAALQSGLG